MGSFSLRAAAEFLFRSVITATVVLVMATPPARADDTPNPGGHWEGKIEGTFTEGGQPIPFSPGREEVNAAKRPQDPEGPFPYKAETVTYPSGSITLAGTLTIPAGAGPFPAVLLISGSGPQDRNETIFEHRPFLVLADYLSRRGIAVLRVDDRGVGGSAGVLSRTTTTELARDALAGVDFLSKRSEVAQDKIGLIGHSEGGMIAPLAASESPKVAFLVLMGAPGLPGDSILTRRTEVLFRGMGTPANPLSAIMEAHHRLLRLIESATDSSALFRPARQLIEAQVALQPEGTKPPPDALDAQARGAVSQMTSPWFRTFLTHDPRVALRKVKVPVLVLQGDLDFQVDPDRNVPQIEAALKSAGNNQVTVRRFPGLNHMFQKAEAGMALEYAAIAETINPAVLSAVAEWIGTEVKGK
jgi:uncharacterized protein